MAALLYSCCVSLPLMLHYKRLHWELNYQKKHFHRVLLRQTQHLPLILSKLHVCLLAVAITSGRHCKTCEHINILLWLCFLTHQQNSFLTLVGRPDIGLVPLSWMYFNLKKSTRYCRDHLHQWKSKNTCFCVEACWHIAWAQLFNKFISKLCLII